jgi:hypothetical protein
MPLRNNPIAGSRLDGLLLIIKRSYGTVALHREGVLTMEMIRISTKIEISRACVGWLSTILDHAS